MQVRVDGSVLGYDDTGSGLPLVLIAGFPAPRRLWDDVTPALAAHGARVIRPDLRGLGESEVVPGPYLMETLASDLARLLDALGVERAALAGHSLGGYVALAFLRMFPERVSAAALVCSRTQADDADVAQRRLALADRVERDGISAVVDEFLPIYFAPSVYDTHPALVARARAWIEAADPRAAAALLRGMAMRVDSGDLLPDITVPFLALAGDEDLRVPRGLLESAARAVPGGRFTAIAGCGHSPMLEAPERVVEELRRLLAV